MRWITLLMESVLKIKLTLDDQNARILDGQSKILNWLYNHLLETANQLRTEYIATQNKEIGLTLYSKRGLRNLIPEIKKNFTFLKSVHSSPLKNGALRLSESIGRFQKLKGKASQKTGWPSFRSWRQKFFSLLYDEPGKGWKLEGRKIKLSLGVDENGKRLHLHGELEKSPDLFPGREIRNLRITKDEEHYYCIFTVKQPDIEKKKIKKVIALDPNHKNLFYGVGTDQRAFEVKNPYFLKTLDRRLDQLKSRRDRCKKRSELIVYENGKKSWKPSRRYQYIQRRINRLLRTRREQTKTFLYTVANWLYKNYDFVSVGDYTPKGGGITRKMRRAMNNESLIGRLKLVLMWVAVKSGKHYDEWCEKGSTRSCHCCGYVVRGGLSPNIRHWQCPECHCAHYRDENAAINGLMETFKKMKLPGSGHHLSQLQIAKERRWIARYDGLGLQLALYAGD